MFPQCPSCNVGGYGKVHLYTGKMVDMYGEGISEALEWFCRQPWQMREADYLEMQEDIKQRLIELGD